MWMVCAARGVYRMGVQVAIESADTRTATDLKALFIDTYNAKFGLVRLPTCV